MCLLVVAWQVVPGTPILIGANRDERLDRPATAMTVLSEREPRVLGGRDHASGGTWLAVNEHGVFAGLTNQPLGDQKDPSRRTRGELPLALTAGRTASEMVDRFLNEHEPADYNGAWLLAGDTESLSFIDFTGVAPATAVPLDPGTYVLENRALGAPSPKVDHVLAMLGDLGDPEVALDAVRRVLADHEDLGGGDDTDERRSLPHCVHLEGYGTRSSCLIRVDDGTLPRLWVADGAPCMTPFAEVKEPWLAGPLS
ncbi:MAG TPA: NRDE family protein [Acidimicrobiales bacterium]|jgi:uncharacterized protein with NRDE domain|nr:NRDE family protein [Acidimicrobiales bacterium]